MGLCSHYFILGISSMFLRIFIYCKLPSPPLPEKLILVCMQTLNPLKENYGQITLPQFGPIIHYCIRKKLTFDPDLVKSYSNNVHTTFDNLSYHGGDGKQKCFCTLR